MIEVIGFITVMLALPFVLALIMRGGAWYRERRLAPDALHDDVFRSGALEPSTDDLFACGRAAATDPAESGPRPWGTRQRPRDFGARRAFGRDAFPSLLPNADDAGSFGAQRNSGFAQVHLRLTDGRGRSVTVERKLCLN